MANALAQNFMAEGGDVCLADLQAKTGEQFGNGLIRSAFLSQLHDDLFGGGK